HFLPPAPPLPLNLGVASPTAKLARRMAPKRREIACRCQLTNYAQCDGLSRSTTLDPLTLPIPPKLGDGPPTQICFAIGWLTERDSVSVPANKLDLLRRTFAWCHARPLARPPPQIGGRFPPCKISFCDWLANEER